MANSLHLSTTGEEIKIAVPRAHSYVEVITITCDATSLTNDTRFSEITLAGIILNETGMSQATSGKAEFLDNGESSQSIRLEQNLFNRGSPTVWSFTQTVRFSNDIIIPARNIRTMSLRIKFSENSSGRYQWFVSYAADSGIAAYNTATGKRVKVTTSNNNGNFIFPASTPSILIKYSQSGNKVITFTGEPHVNHVLEATTNLLSWKPVANIRGNASGNYIWTPFTPVNEETFYRVRVAPELNGSGDESFWK